jgi:alkylhydroperoxidase/carboxymuconolactone decarboxylase family protein YurZ
MDDQIPSNYEEFQINYPEIWQAYDRLGAAIHEQGPLDDKTRQLVKLALAIGVRSEGAVHSHTRKCLALGITAAEIRQVVLLAIPTAGYPTAMAALTWVNDLLE